MAGPVNVSKEGAAVAAAVVLAAQGAQNAARPKLASVMRLGPAATSATLATLAEIYFYAVGQAERTGDFELRVYAPDGRRASAQEMPPPLRFVAQFLAAWANRDRDSAMALFEALIMQDEENDTDHSVEGAFKLLDTTAAAVREKLQEGAQ